MGERRMDELQSEVFKLVQSLHRRVVFLRDVLQCPEFANNTLSVITALSEVAQAECDYQQAQSVSGAEVSI